MQTAKAKAELLQQKHKLASSYAELQNEFSSSDLRHVGNYTLGKLVGKGSFGKVYLAKHKLTNGSKVVLKSSKKDDHNLVREIHHHRQFVHPHIARLYEVIVTENLVWMVLEYCPGDELYHYLLRTGPLSVETSQKIFTQLVGAVAYIHSKSCVHRDLKLENVLLDKNENVKLCDFGFTREYEGKSNYLQTFCGTVCYSAPEMLRGEKYAGEKVDVWSLGIILFALLKGELPFDEEDDHATKARILKEDPVYPATFPEAAKTLISKLLSKRPLHRPTLAELMADPFLSDHAPAQQAILKLSQPAPFTTDLEKATLERMKSAGVDIDNVIENVLSQRCDALAGWWAILIEKEQRKEARRERKRKQKEAEMKLLRRLSAASSRLDKLGPTLEDVPENGQEEMNPLGLSRHRSLSRGRSQRRSTPQIMISDLPKLPEGSTTDAAERDTTLDAASKLVEQEDVWDKKRSGSGSRPPIPSKERKRRSSNLQLMSSNPDLLGPVNGVTKRRPRRRNNQFLQTLTHLKHWFVDAAKSAKSPRRAQLATDIPANNRSLTKVNHSAPSPTPGHTRMLSGASMASRSTYGPTLTPTDPRSIKLDTSRVQPRTSRSPVTPISSYRHSSGGLRGRKSTSSSVSSIRSLHRHSKASSISSHSESLDTVQSPARSTGRSPSSSSKVLPNTPTTPFASQNRHARDSAGTELFPSARSLPAEDASNQHIMFTKRKKSPFKGAHLSPVIYTNAIPPSQASPVVRGREAFAMTKDLNRRSNVASKQRKSQIIEEEDEEAEDGEIEEVEDFEPIDLRRGERVHSIVIWDDGGPPEGQHEDAKPPEFTLPEIEIESEATSPGFGVVTPPLDGVTNGINGSVLPKTNGIEK